MTVAIYHNQACGTSRNVLTLIRNSGEEPRVIEYLKTPPSRGELVELIGRMGISVRDYMETPILSAVAKVMLGGALVLAAGILIGNG